jgi:hypothetical protein
MFSEPENYYPFQSKNHSNIQFGTTSLKTQSPHKIFLDIQNMYSGVRNNDGYDSHIECQEDLTFPLFPDTEPFNLAKYIIYDAKNIQKLRTMLIVLFHDFPLIS